MSQSLSGAEFKKQLREGRPKFGLFVNSHSPTVVEQLAHSGYDWMLVDTQHGPMGNETLSGMLSGIANGGAISMVRVGGASDRPGIQQALDMGADGVLVPYINNAAEAREAVSCTRYPLAPLNGTRSVYFPQRSMNAKGLLGYAGAANENVITALQVETADCIKNIDEIAATPGLDMLFLGQNDLCMSMGLFNGKYKFPDMYFSDELREATNKLINAARKNNLILGLFLFGTSRVGEFLEKGFPFISIGNDLHHILTQSGAYVGELEKIAKEKSKVGWSRRPTSLF
jgi:4-hydroxy-2-oxoheptanedioate aldolase